MLYNGRKIAHNSEKEEVKERIFCLTHFLPVEDSSTGERLPEPSLTTE
jgi:hypothetical protein